jgi:hypothetical protein
MARAASIAVVARTEPLAGLAGNGSSHGMQVGKPGRDEIEKGRLIGR